MLTHPTTPIEFRKQRGQIMDGKPALREEECCGDERSAARQWVRVGWCDNGAWRRGWHSNGMMWRRIKKVLNSGRDTCK
jgi:hypothetical protein